MRIFFDAPFMDAVALICVIIGLIYYYCTSNNNHWKNKGVPYLKPQFFFGNIKDLLTFKVSQPELLSQFYTHFKKQG